MTRAQRPPGWLVLSVVWILAVLFTHPTTAGDTEDYIGSVAARLQGLDYNFWEFGHLLWRPLATLTTRLAIALSGSTDLRIVALQPMVWLNVAAALGAALLLVAVLVSLRAASWAAVPIAVAFLLTQGVLNYAQSGTPYIPGLFLLNAGFLAAVFAAHKGRAVHALIAGVLGALAAAFWFPYVLVIPALAAAAVLLGKDDGWQRALLVLTAAAVTGCALFLGIAFAIGIRSPARFADWAASASHGIVGISGPTRMALGFGRSFLFIGEDGAVMRRFLLGDPFAPVSVSQFLTTRVWLLALVWLVGFAVLVHVTRSRAFRMLGVFFIAALPTFAFALFWQGGDIERYLPLYPFLFMIIHELFTSPRYGGTRVLRITVMAGLLFMAVNNVYGLSAEAADGRRAAVESRLAGLAPSVREGDILICSHLQDDMVAVRNSFPFERFNSDVDLRVKPLVLLGEGQAEIWRREFATQVQNIWNEGKQVWISTRLLAPTPKPEWNWIEGSDARVSWRDFSVFFSALQLGPPSTNDGFVLLERTPHNQSVLDGLLQQAR